MNELEFASEEPEASPAIEDAAPEDLKQEPAAPTMASKWKAATARWAKESGIAYFANPAARRDFRVQFRGNRSAWLFTIYVVTLGVLSLYEYWNISHIPFEPFTVQSRLFEFCEVLLGALGVVITLVAPALSATSILAERQRKSLDLVFVAPVKPRTYLIGKIVASYRYTWILLALSLPFTAMAVMMGGKSWGDILGAYFLLSIQGIVFTSIGLLFSSMVEKAFSAILYTYAAVVAYLLGLTALVGLTSQGFSNFGGGEISPFMAMNPFLVLQAAGSYTTILGIPVPNVLIASGLSLIVVRMLLAAAGNLLTPPKPRERANLRLSATLSLAGLVTYITAHPFAGDSNGDVKPLIMCVMLMPLLAFVPFFACYGTDGEQIHKPNGVFDLKRAFTGSPAGALPYLWLTIAACVGATSLGALVSHQPLSLNLPAYALYAFGFWTFVWSTARFASSFLMGLKVSRTVQFITVLSVIGLPVPLFAWMAQHMGGDGVVRSFPWTAYILDPLLLANNSAVAFIQGFVLLILGAMIAWWSEGNLARRMAEKQLKRAATTAKSSSPVATATFDHLGRLTRGLNDDQSQSRRDDPTA